MHNEWIYCISVFDLFVAQIFHFLEFDVLIRSVSAHFLKQDLKQLICDVRGQLFDTVHAPLVKIIFRAVAVEGAFSGVPAKSLYLVSSTLRTHQRKTVSFLVLSLRVCTYFPHAHCYFHFHLVYQVHRNWVLRREA